MKKINTIALGRLNNAEYANFSLRTIDNIRAATIAKLGITQAQLDAYLANYKLLENIVAQSRVADETVDIAAVDQECDQLISYLLGTIKTARKSPVAAVREAAVRLYNVTHPYAGTQGKPRNQQVQMTRGLLADITTDQSAQDLETLGLVTAEEELNRKNRRYAELLLERDNALAATRLEPGEDVRNRMTPQYDAMTTMAFATSLTSPTPEADTFITNQNALIDSTTATYNQRIAQLRRAAKAENNETLNTEIE